MDKPAKMSKVEFNDKKLSKENTCQRICFKKGRLAGTDG